MSYEYNLDIEVWEEDGEYFYYVIQQHGRGKSTLLANGQADSLDDIKDDVLQAVKDVL